MKKKRGRRENKERFILVASLIFSLIFFISFSLADPTGPTSLNITSNETKATTGGQIINISGGYISKVNVTATVQNPHWKAFVGWIDGKFTLDDASGSTIYDWTLSSISGEIYATRDATTPSWSTTSCANASSIIIEDLALNHTGSDNISTTFSGTNSNTFVTAGQTISAGACSATNTYVNNVTQSATFEEVILYDNSSTIVFASVLESDSTGYDGNTYDFQLLAPENANETFTSSTAYYLYVELS